MNAFNAGIAGVDPNTLAVFNPDLVPSVYGHFAGDQVALDNEESCDDLLSDAQRHRDAAAAAVDLGDLFLAGRQTQAMNEAYAEFCSRCRNHPSYTQVCNDGTAPVVS